MRGRFTPGAQRATSGASAACSRASTATRSTGCAREIEPVAARDFMRFLFDWQHVAPRRAHARAPKALDGGRRAARRLRGAGRRVGERDPAGARRDYRSALARRRAASPGRVAWTRLRRAAPRRWRAPDRAGARDADRAAAAPPRRAVARAAAGATDERSRAPRAQRASLDFLPAQRRLVLRRARRRHAACCAPQVEEALAELVARGLRHLRQLRRPARAAGARPSERRPRGAPPPPARRCSASRTPAAGRWCARGRTPTQRDADAVEHVARTLLRRYGVVFWRLLEREAAWLPPWRELLRVYRRLEARGEIRGGRFVAGFSGEQFALPEAIGALREVRRQPHDGEWLVGVGRRSAQPRRHPHAGTAACRRSPAIALLYRRRRAGRDAERRRGPAVRRGSIRRPTG